MKSISEWVKNVTREVTIFPATGVTRSFGRVAQAFDIPFDYEHILFVDNTWFYKEKDYETIKAIFREKIEADTDYILKIADKQKEVGEKLKQYVRKLARKKFSRKELAKKVLEYDEHITQFYSFWWIAIPAGEVLEEKVHALLKRRGSPIKFEDLMFVRDELELVREKRLRNKIGPKYKQYENFKSLPTDLKKELKNHAKKFGWINTSYHIGSPLTAEDFFEKIHSENPTAEAKHMEGERKREKTTLQTLAKVFTPEEQKLIQAMQTVMYLRNYQKETVNECQHKSEPFLQMVADELGVELKTALAFSPQELHDHLRSKTVSPKDLKLIAEKRAKGFIIEYKNKNVAVHEDTAKYQAMVKSGLETANKGKITGSPARPGHVRGKVRVITKKEDIASFIDGEVLVTVMTSIDYVHIMKRASAIVTDEGGITCHAAIFSREFGVPCIIGTKVATQILKDGDEVEVDADKGIVKVLQKKN